jgi:hypothetical protein
MKKIAQSTCVLCHEIKPRTEMRQISVSEHVGSSYGVSKNTRRDDSTRVSVRSYSASRKKWICDACWQSRPKYLPTLLYTLFLNPLFVPKYRGMSVFTGLLYVGTLGLFGTFWLLFALMALFGQFEDERGLPNSRL